MDKEQTHKRLIEASDAYYNTDQPLMGDAEFDALKRRYEAKFGPLDIGVAPPRGSKTGMHVAPMLSLENVFEQEGSEALSELRGWLMPLGKQTLISVQPKIDGLSLSLRYEDGKLVQALTRGDGVTGEDVTENVRHFVPPEIPHQHLVQVTGEVFMRQQIFETLNQAREAEGKKRMANPRNAASGALRLKDPAESRARELSFVAFGLHKSFKVYDQTQVIAHLGEAGFETPFTATSEVSRWLDYDVEGLRKLVLYDADTPNDGIVFKVCAADIQTRMGSNSRAPRWAVALKLRPEEKTTVVRQITMQVGRSGIFTPVAELEPLILDGTTVRRATLHNEKRVQDLGLLCGDRVVVRKAGHIIPEIVRVEGTGARAKKFDVQTHLGGVCPCGLKSPILRTPAKEGGGFTYSCASEVCPSVIAGKLCRAVSREVLDVEGLGTEGVKAVAIQRHSYREALASLWELTESELAELSWETEAGGRMTLGSSRAKEVKKQLERALTQPLARWIVALNIPRIGINSAKELARLYPDGEQLRAAIQNPQSALSLLADGVKKTDDRLALLQIRQTLGKVDCLNLRAFEQSAEGRDLLALLAEMNLPNPDYDPVPEKVSGPFDGEKVVITGTLSVERDEMKALLEAAGATVAGSVSGKTTLMVAGENAGSKLEKARNLGIRILSEVEVRERLG